MLWFICGRIKIINIVFGLVLIDVKIFIFLWKMYVKNFIGSYYLLKYVYFYDNGFKYYLFFVIEGEYDVVCIKWVFGSFVLFCNSKWEFNVFDFFVFK